MGTITIDGKIYEYASASIVTGPGEPPVPPPSVFVPFSQPVPVSPAPPSETTVATPSSPCPPGLTIQEMSLDWDADNGKSFQLPVTTGVAHIISFTTGPASHDPGLMAMGEYTGYPAERTVIVSPQRCEFDIQKAGIGSFGVKPNIFFVVGTDKPGYQRLEANTKYYMHVISENYQSRGNDTCPVGERCDFTFSLRHA